MTVRNDWTTPYCGVSHLGKPGDDRWATINQYATGCELLMWYRGCGFSPNRAWFPTVDSARFDGAKWVNGGI